MEKRESCAVEAAVRLRQALEEVADSLAHAELGGLLSAESALERALPGLTVPANGLMREKLPAGVVGLLELPSAIGSGKQPKPSLTAAGAPPVELARWWQCLNDPELDSLVSRAIEANLDLGIALARVQEARTKVAGAVGQALPSVIGSEGAGWGTGQDATRSRVANELRSGENGTGLNQVTQGVGVYTDWEIDLFGKFRREIEAARYDAEAAIAARNAVLISVVAELGPYARVE